MNWTLEVVVVPVSDVDRAREFYAGQLGCPVDHDTRMGEGARLVQLTPPGWPLEATFTTIEPPRRLMYEARSWTEGEQGTTTIEHVNELELSETDDGTAVILRVAIGEVGSGAKMAAFGMKWGYKAQLDELQAVLER